MRIIVRRRTHLTLMIIGSVVMLCYLAMYRRFSKPLIDVNVEIAIDRKQVPKENQLLDFVQDVISLVDQYPDSGIGRDIYVNPGLVKLGESGEQAFVDSHNIQANAEESVEVAQRAIEKQRSDRGLVVQSNADGSSEQYNSEMNSAKNADAMAAANQKFSALGADVESAVEEVAVRATVDIGQEPVGQAEQVAEATESQPRATERAAADINRKLRQWQPHLDQLVAARQALAVRKKAETFSDLQSATPRRKNARHGEPMFLSFETKSPLTTTTPFVTNKHGRKKIVYEKPHLISRLLSKEHDPGLYIFASDDAPASGAARRAALNKSSQNGFHRDISNVELYPASSPHVDQLLSDMAQLPVLYVATKSGGTQMKFIVHYSDRSVAIMKPMRYPREQDAWPNSTYAYDFERPMAEIAAFHLDRLIGFRRVPPTSGRVFNITNDIKDKLNDSALLDTFFVSDAGDSCFYGTCKVFCDKEHAFCGTPGDVLEAAVQTYMPFKEYAPRLNWVSPYRRLYLDVGQSDWEINEDYCDRFARLQYPMSDDSNRFLLDLVDLHIFDFLMGNMDRHHFDTVAEFGNQSAFLVVDSGRGFGRPSTDEMSILAPLQQCCSIRYSTLQRLLDLWHDDVSLAERLDRSLQTDPLWPVLTVPHLVALDRRLPIVLHAVRSCVAKSSFESVVIDDGF